ncbi:MAG: carboxymuconolactone decarboxylase family protein [Pseudooceanicola sp.]
MTDFTFHDADTAPGPSRGLIEQARAGYGALPNLHAVMAEAPGLLEGYMTLHRLFTETSFDADEQTVVWQSINVEHDCHYCVPAHTAIAKRTGVSDEISNALRDERPLPTPRLEALRDFTLEMVRRRGDVRGRALSDFLDAGFTRRHVLEVVLAVSQKVMSNYTNAFVQTPVESYFQPFAWTKSTPVSA